MNCKPGDLAVIVNDEHPMNVGRLVKVLESGTYWPFDPRPHWLVEAIGSPLFNLKTDGNDMPTGFFATEATGECADADLRPIRDPGDEAQDESKSWLPPVPSSHKETA